MSERSNAEVVRDIYDEFLRGDIDAIVARLHPDVHWAVEAAVPAAPWHGSFRGAATVPDFFTAVNVNVEVTQFDPFVIASAGDDVLAAIRFTYRARASGRQVSMGIYHWWRFRDRLVISFRASEDTAVTAAVMSKT